MADPTLVNGQITDAVTQANVKVLGDAPAMAMGAIYQTLAQAAGLAMQNAVAAQQQMNTISQAATTQGVNLLFSLGDMEVDELVHLHKPGEEDADATGDVDGGATAPAEL